MIFYEPLIRVYKSANVYNSVTDFAVFVDDMIQVVEKAQKQGGYSQSSALLGSIRFTDQL